MISFSGIDCSGKSTQIALLKEEFRKRNYKYRVIWSRGCYTPGIELVKNILRRNNFISNEERLQQSKKINENLKKRKLLFIFSLVDLWFYYAIVLRLIEMFGVEVVCDRYIWDTYIDFKIKYPEYRFENWFLWKIVLITMLKPKLSFMFHIPAEESMRRSDLKDEPFPELFDLRERRIQLYLNEMKKNRWQYFVDATKPINEVFLEITKNIV